jgi:transposase
VVGISVARHEGLFNRRMDIDQPGGVSMDQAESPSSVVDSSSFAFVVGIDIGSAWCSFCILKPDKSQVIKPTEFANTMSGFAALQGHLEPLRVAPGQILIGLEATSRYGENLYHFLEQRGYSLCLLHPRQTHQFALQRGLRAKTDRLDASTIARVLLSGEARRGYVPSELIATYRELVRLHSQLSDDIARYKNEIHALLSVLFPEFLQVFADPCRLTALAVLKRYPSAQAMAAAGVEAIVGIFQQVAPHNYGSKTAQQLIDLAQHSTSSGMAISARSRSLKVLCDQLEHTQTNLTQLEEEIDHLLNSDSGAKGVRSVPEFGRKMVAVLRAELGDVARFQRADQVVAYAGLDIEVRQSGKWRGEAKLSKRGSGRLRRLLYMTAVRCIRLKDSAFGVYYHRLLARGMKPRAALVAVMRKMLLVAYRLLRTQETYDPARVCAPSLARATVRIPSPDKLAARRA